jgi:hypothetical protein
MSSRTFTVNDQVFRAIKIDAVNRDMSIQTVVRDAVERFIEAGADLNAAPAGLVAGRATRLLILNLDADTESKFAAAARRHGVRKSVIARAALAARYAEALAVSR